MLVQKVFPSFQLYFLCELVTPPLSLNSYTRSFTKGLGALEMAAQPTIKGTGAIAGVGPKLHTSGRSSIPLTYHFPLRKPF